MIPQYLKDIQSYVDSRPYGAVSIPEIKIVNRKVTEVTTEGRETLRYTDTEAALNDVLRILTNLSSIGYSGNAHVELEYIDGAIKIIAIHDKRHTRYN